MIPGLYIFDLEYQFNIKYNRYRFKFFDRYYIFEFEFWPLEISNLSFVSIENFPDLYCTQPQNMGF